MVRLENKTARRGEYIPYCMIESLHQYIKSCNNEQILDIGCGGGLSPMVLRTYAGAVPVAEAKGALRGLGGKYVWPMHPPQNVMPESPAGPVGPGQLIAVRLSVGVGSILEPV